MRNLCFFSFLLLSSVAISQTSVSITGPQKETIDAILIKFRMDPLAAMEDVKKLGVTPYDFGISVAQKRRADAIDWFRILSKNTKDKNLDYHFGLAWVYWADQDIENAHHQLSYILSKNPEPKLKARTLVLMGHIFNRFREYDKARGFIEESMSIYNQLRLVGGVVNGHVAIISQYYDLNKLDEMELELKKAETLNRTRSNPIDKEAELQYYKGSLLFKRGDYKKAMELYQTVCASDFLEEEYRQISKSNIAICATLLKDSDKALKNVMEVDDFIKETGIDDSLINYYNKTAWLMINRCQGFDLNAMRDNIKAWNERKGPEKGLEDLLRFVELVKCP